MSNDRSERITFRVSDKELEKINRKLREDGYRSISEFVRTSIVLNIADVRPADLIVINHCDFEDREFKKFNGKIKLWCAGHEPDDPHQYRELIRLLEQFEKETRRRHHELMRELKINRKGP